MPTTTRTTVNHQKGEASAAKPAGAFPLFASFFRRPALLLGLLALGALGFGYAIAVPAVNMDDLALASYYDNGEFLRQDRFTLWLLERFTGIMEYQAHWPELFAAISLALAGLLLAAVLYAVLGQKKPGTPAVLLLAGGLLVWPYHVELLVYSTQCGMGLDFLLCALALALSYRFILAGKAPWGALLGSVCIALALGCYQSFAVVWLVLVCVLLLTAAVAAPADSVNFKANALRLVRGAAPLLAGLVWRALASAALRGLMGVTGENTTTSTTIFWFQRGSLRDALLIPLREWIDNYLALPFGVPALALLLLAEAALVVYAFRRRKQVKNGFCFWVLALLLAQYTLGILQGTGSQMARTVQCFAVFVPFVAWLLLRDCLPRELAGLKSAKSIAATAVAAVLLVVEVLALADAFRFDRDRWQYEKMTLQTIGSELDALDPGGTLPVVFTGELGTLPPELEARAALGPNNPAYKVTYLVSALLGGAQGTLYRYENPNILVIDWAQTAFGSHAQMYLLMEYTGRACVAPTPEQQAAADALEGVEPGVSARDGYLLVHL